MYLVYLVSQGRTRTDREEEKASAAASEDGPAAAAAAASGGEAVPGPRYVIHVRNQSEEEEWSELS